MNVINDLQQFCMLSDVCIILLVFPHKIFFDLELLPGNHFLLPESFLEIPQPGNCCNWLPKITSNPKRLLQKPVNDFDPSRLTNFKFYLDRPLSSYH